MADAPLLVAPVLREVRRAPLADAAAEVFQAPPWCKHRPDSTHVITRSSLSAVISSHEYDSSRRISSVCSPTSGCARHRPRRAVFVERDGTRHDLEGRVGADVDGGEEAVAAGLLVVQQVGRHLDRCPRTGEARDRVAPVLVGVRREELVEDGDALLAVLLPRGDGREPLVRREHRHAHRSAELVPIGLGIDHGERDEAMVLRAVRPGPRVASRSADRALGRVRPVDLRTQDVALHLPHPDVQQGDVDDRRFPLRGAAVERGGDATGEGHCRHHVAECGPLVQRSLRAARRQRGRDPSTRPVRGPVEGRGLGERSVLPEARPADVDDVVVHRADVVHVDAESRANARPEVGHEDVGPSHQFAQQLAAAWLREVEPERTLPAVRVLEAQIDAVDRRRHTRGHETPVRITRFRMLHLDDLGAPVGEHHAGERHEDERPDLDDLDLTENLEHVADRRSSGHPTARVLTRRSSERRPGSHP